MEEDFLSLYSYCNCREKSKVKKREWEEARKRK
jgi:hypothetical protein